MIQVAVTLTKKINVSTVVKGGGGGGIINVYLDAILQSSTPSSNLNAEIVNIIWT